MRLKSWMTDRQKSRPERIPASIVVDGNKKEKYISSFGYYYIIDCGE